MYTVLVNKRKWEGSLERRRRRRDDNIKIDVKENGFEDVVCV